MESKGIAIPYIIALVIGIIVLVFIVYWVYRIFSGPQITLEDCRSRLIQWCNQCKVNNWADTGVNNRQAVGDECVTILKDKLGISFGANDAGIACSQTECAKIGIS